MRYHVKKGSESAHCCFEATVIDIKKDNEWVCECFEVENAELITKALQVMPLLAEYFTLKDKSINGLGVYEAEKLDAILKTVEQFVMELDPTLAEHMHDAYK